MNNASSDKNTAVFRSSISGFNKEDVNNYIIKMNRDFKEKEADHQDEIEQIRSDADSKISAAADREEKIKDEVNTLKNEIRKLELENEALKEKYAALEKDFEDTLSTQINSDTVASSEIERLKAVHEENIDNLKNSIAAEKEKTSACEKIISEQANLIDSMKEEKDALIKAKINAEETSKLLSEQIQAMTAGDEKDEVIEKSQLYDQISRQVGDILINANKTSEEIIERANIRAEEIIDDAEEEADERRKHIEKTTEVIIRKFKKDMNSTFDLCYDEISASLNEMQYDAASLLAEMEKRRKELAEKISYHKSALSDSVKENLASIDKPVTSQTDFGIRLTDE